MGERETLRLVESGADAAENDRAEGRRNEG